jgi:hypothetical protein
VAWASSRFYRWFSGAWKDGDTISATCTINWCNMFSMQQVQQFCNKCVLSVQTFLSKDICEYSGQDLGKMHMRYMQWTCENHLCVCIGWTCNSAIPPCLSGLIWINQKPTQNKKLKPRLGNQSWNQNILLHSFVASRLYNNRSKQKGKQMPVVQTIF